MHSIILPYGVEYAAAGAMLSAVLGEVASLLFLLTLFQRENIYQYALDFSLL